MLHSMPHPAAEPTKPGAGLSVASLSLACCRCAAPAPPAAPAGVGTVNAVEITQAFPSLEDLRRFKQWVEGPGDDLLSLLDAGGRAAGEHLPRGLSPGRRAGKAYAKVTWLAGCTCSVA